MGELKEELDLRVHQPDREREVLAPVRAANSGPLDSETVERLFDDVLGMRRRILPPNHPSTAASQMWLASEIIREWLLSRYC